MQKVSMQVYQEMLYRTATERDPEKKLVLKVASRWLWASLRGDYDVFLRLQVLEGAAGVNVGHWWKKGKAALPVARAAFEHDSVDPSWFTPSESDMFGVLNNTCSRALQQYHVPLESFDFINNALMGIPMNPMDREILHSPYEVGKASAAKIKSGVEVPGSIAGGPLGKYLVRKIMNEARSLHVREHANIHQNQGENEDGSSRNEFENLPDESRGSPFTDVGQFIYDTIFHDHTSSLGTKLRSLMHQVWESGPAYKNTMIPWMEDALAGRTKLLRSYADAVGIKPQTFTDAHWNIAWRDFFKAIRANPSLVRLLEEEAHAVGLGWDREEKIPFNTKDPIEAIKQRRPRRKLAIALQRVPLEKAWNEVSRIPASGNSSFGGIGEFIDYLIFHDSSSSLGGKLRYLLQRVWGNKQQAYSRTMPLWLENTLRGQKLPFKDYAERAGISAQTFSQRHWDPAWRDFFRALKSSPSLLGQIEQEAEMNGLEWDRMDALAFNAKDPMKAIRSKRPLRHASCQVESLVERWFFKHSC